MALNVRMKVDVRMKLNLLAAYLNKPQAEVIEMLVDAEMKRLHDAKLLMVAEDPAPYGQGEQRKGA